MEFKFAVNDIFRQPIVEINHNLIPPGFSGDRRAYWDTVAKISEVVNAMGEASAAAQGLTKPITTAERLRNSEQSLYLLIDKSAGNGRGAITGMLKTGKKGLYVFDRNGQHFQVSPPCVLDFYVHESRQRMGLGKQIFEHMLEKESITPVKMAIDRPSTKFLGFLNKHYNLNNPVKQMNNFVVFDGFFPSGSTPEKNPAVEINQSGGATPGRKQSANGLQSSNYASPSGRYGAPRPPCSMGQIIHNQTSTLPKSAEPTGVMSAPQLYNGQPSPTYPTNASQSTPNTTYQQQPCTQANEQMQFSNNGYNNYGTDQWRQQQPQHVLQAHHAAEQPAYPANKTGGVQSNYYTANNLAQQQQNYHAAQQAMATQQGQHNQYATYPQNVATQDPRLPGAAIQEPLTSYQQNVASRPQSHYQDPRYSTPHLPVQGIASAPAHLAQYNNMWAPGQTAQTVPVQNEMSYSGQILQPGQPQTTGSNNQMLPPVTTQSMVVPGAAPQTIAMQASYSAPISYQSQPQYQYSQDPEQHMPQYPQAVASTREVAQTPGQVQTQEPVRYEQDPQAYVTSSGDQKDRTVDRVASSQQIQQAATVNVRQFAQNDSEPAQNVHKRAPQGSGRIRSQLESQQMAMIMGARSQTLKDGVSQLMKGLPPKAIQRQDGTQQPQSAMYQPQTAVHQPQTVAHQPQTVAHQPQTLAHQPQTVAHQPQTVAHHQPYTLAHQPQTVAHQPQTVAHQPQTLAHQPQTVAHHQPQSATYQPQTAVHQPQTVAHQPQNTTYQPQTVAHQSQTVAHQPQTVAHQPQTVAYQPQTATYQPQTVTHQPQTVAHHPQTLAHQPQSVAHQPYNFTHQPQSATYQPQSVEQQHNVANQPLQNAAYQTQSVTHQPQNLYQLQNSKGESQVPESTGHMEGSHLEPNNANQNYQMPSANDAKGDTQVEERVNNASPKLERPRSLSIQISDEQEQTAEDKVDHVESEVPPLKKDNIQDKLVDNDKIQPVEQPAKKATPSHLTEQGFFDLKFYHNKLW